MDLALAGKVLKTLGEERTETLKLLELFQDAGLDVMRITCTEEQYKWYKAPYRSNEMYKDELLHVTNGGVRVRSKSERSIGNLLEKYGIPYRYEMEMRVNVSWMQGVEIYDGSGYKSYYPDFTIMLPSGRLVI
ncbi:MAG: hypothetical protein PUB09_05320 [Firmicutes bacterium]|nr:hypothetical protein [Bacillota bacterium]